MNNRIVTRRSAPSHNRGGPDPSFDPLSRFHKHRHQKRNTFYHNPPRLNHPYQLPGITCAQMRIITFLSCPVIYVVLICQRVTTILLVLLIYG